MSLSITVRPLASRTLRQSRQLQTTTTTTYSTQIHNTRDVTLSSSELARAEHAGGRFKVKVVDGKVERRCVMRVFDGDVSALIDEQFYRRKMAAGTREVQSSVLRKKIYSCSSNYE